MTLKRKKVFFITTGAITLAVFALALVLLLNIQAFKPRLEAAASNALGMDVRIRGRLGGSLFPAGISLKHISVRSGGADIAAVENMRIGLELFRGREFRVSRVEIIKPVFSIVRRKNGTFNFQKPGPALLGKPLAVKNISVSHGRLVYTDEVFGARMEMDDFNMAIRNFSYGGMNGANPFKNISFAGDIKCKTLAVNRFTLTNLVMKIAGGNGMLEANPVRLDAFGGTGNGSIHVDAAAAPLHYRVIAALNRFRIAELIQAFSSANIPPRSLEGRADFSADLTAAGRSAQEVKRSLNGDISFNGESIMLYGIDIDALIPKYERSQNFNLVDVGAFFLAGPFGPALTKSYNFASLYKESRGGKGVIRKLVSLWKVKKGVAGAADVALATKKQRIAMKGGLDLNNERLKDLTVAVLNKRGCAVYSQKVHGPFSKPRIEKMSVFKSITGSVSNAVGSAVNFIGGGGCKVFYSGSVAQPEG